MILRRKQPQQLCRSPALVPAALLGIISFGAPAAAQDAVATAFVNVSIIPMDTERVLPDHTVVVEGELIAAVGPVSDVVVPTGAKIIDGEGAFLMPGLADMHAHLNLDPSPDFMRLFLAEGVTTVRNLNALPRHIEWKDEVVRGTRIGPTLYTSGPVIVGPPDPIIVWMFRALILGVLLAGGLAVWTALWLLRRLRGRTEDARRLRRTLLPGALAILALGLVILWTKAIPINTYTVRQFPFAYVPDTVERARAEVRRQVEAGYDLIKMYDYLPRDLYLGAIEEARAQGMYVVGHLDHGVEDPLAAGLREAVHVDEFLDEHLMGKMSPRAFESIPMNLETIHESIASVVRHDALVVSNLVTDEITYEYLEQGPGYFARPEYARLRPAIITGWLGGRMVDWQGQQEWRRNTLQPFLVRMIQSLHTAGVPILIGTDTGTEGALPWHIHSDLELLVEAGLSPFEALAAGTKNARLSVNRMGVADVFGEVAVGQRADLILVKSNPLENVGATRTRLGVMSRGRWYAQEELERLVADLVTTYMSEPR